jgi:type I restriction enzyme M protein
MNLAIRGITADLGEEAADTFSKDQHKDLKADFILANPPFNLGDWRAKDELVDDSRWASFGLPPASNANYAWILHMISKLSQNGVAGFLLANGALGDPDTRTIRQQILDQDLVEAIITLPRDMFYSTDISVTLWIVNRNKRSRTAQLHDRTVNYRDRTGEVLFLDLRRRGNEVDKKYIELSVDQIAEITNDFRIWRGEVAGSTHRNIPEYSYSASIEEIRAKDYSLIPSKYVQFVDADLAIDFASEMKGLQKELAAALKAEAQAHTNLTEAFDGLGYGL